MTFDLIFVLSVLSKIVALAVRLDNTQVYLNKLLGVTLNRDSRSSFPNSRGPFLVTVIAITQVPNIFLKYLDFREDPPELF
jgi:hypothetical protein